MLLTSDAYLRGSVVCETGYLGEDFGSRLQNGGLTMCLPNVLRGQEVSVIQWKPVWGG